MQVKDMGLSWIVVSDMAKAKALYIDILGFEIYEENPEYGWLEVKCGNSILGIWQASDDSSCSKGDKPGQNAVLTFVVDDIIKSKQEFEQKNVKILGDIIEMPGQFKMLSFVDADGNKCQLYQKLS